MIKKTVTKDSNYMTKVPYLKIVRNVKNVKN